MLYYILYHTMLSRGVHHLCLHPNCFLNACHLAANGSWKRRSYSGKYSDKRIGDGDSDKHIGDGDALYSSARAYVFTSGRCIVWDGVGSEYERGGCTAMGV